MQSISANANRPAKLRKFRLILGLSILAAALIGFSSSALATPALAPTDASWASSFGLPGLDIAPSAVAVSGSQVYAGGTFTKADGGVTGYNHIAKWTGGGWVPLGSGLNGAVHAITVVGGTVYVGGNFTSAGGVAVSNLAAWNGTSWSSVGGGAGGEVDALAYHNGVLYVGGSFASVDAGKTSANSIAAYTVVGGGWSTLAGGVTNCHGCSAAQVNALAWNPVLGRLFVTGYFRLAGPSTVNGFAAWNGSAWQAYGGGLTYTTGGAATGDSLAVDPVSGATYVGGTFQKAGATTATNLAELSGSTWSAPGNITYANNTRATVNAVALIGSTLYAAGQFDTAAGVKAANFAAKGGGLWRQVGSGINGAGYALAPAGTSSVVIVGQFSYAGSSFPYTGSPLLDYIGQWNGSAWSTFGQGLVTQPSPTSGEISALLATGYGVYAGGSFTQAGAMLTSSIARWTGTGWAPLSGGLRQQNGTPGIVYAITAIGSDIYVGGAFASAGGIAANNLAMWDGTGWHAVGAPKVLGAGLNAPVYALKSLLGNLYVGGGFSEADGVAANDIAKYAPATGAWSAIGANPVYAIPSQGSTGAVRALASYGNRFLLIGGDFQQIGPSSGNGASADGFAYFDTALTNFPAPTSGYHFPGGVSGCCATVWTILVMPNAPNGDVYLGGAYDHAGVSATSTGIPASNIADWETAPPGGGGPRWAALGTGTDGAVNALSDTATTTAGTTTTPVLYLAGSFAHAGHVGAAGVASYTPSTQLFLPLGSGLGYAAFTYGPGAYALAQNPSAGLFVGGKFLTAGAKPSDGLALWTATSGLKP